MLDPTSALPLYHQLKEALRRQIEAGAWRPHQAIPPERSLIERYSVSRITVRQALTDLVGEGLLYRERGRGTFVAARVRPPIAEMLSNLTGHVEELQHRGFTPVVEVLSLTERLLPDDLAQVLDRPVGSPVWWLSRRVSVEGEPLMLAENLIPADLGIPFDRQDLTQTPIARVLEEFGLVPTRGTQRISAQVAGTREAELLQVRVGEALLKVERVISGPGDRPLEWSRTVYRADRYEYEVELRRRR